MDTAFAKFDPWDTIIKKTIKGMAFFESLNLELLNMKSGGGVNKIS
jgi:hypothetical protein